MNTLDINKVVYLCREVERLGKEVMAEAERDGTTAGSIWGTRKSGELRRRSMDLTRALADMRR